MTNENGHTQTIFTLAHTDVSTMPFNNRKRTLRLVVPVNVETSTLQVRFSNRCGKAPITIGAASLAVCDAEGGLRPGTLIPLTVEGVLDFMLIPGQEVWSDECCLTLHPGDHLALNLYYPTDEKVTSGNWLGQSAQRSHFGNFSADLSLPRPNLVSRLARTVIATDMTVSITTVGQIDARCENAGRVLGCFGDSVTQQCNWTLPLEKLLHRRYPGGISLCNLGISGNKLLRPSPPDMGDLFGQAGIDRFEHDLLGVTGLTHAVLALGANDLGHPGSQGMPASELLTEDDYTSAMGNLADRLHARGVKVFCATITPRTITKPYDEAREMLRRKLNNWLRTTDHFDAVLDFDRVLERPDGKPGMRDGCVLPDGLHPSPYGGLLMAKSIDLELFA